MITKLAKNIFLPPEMICVKCLNQIPFCQKNIFNSIAEEEGYFLSSIQSEDYLSALFFAISSFCNPKNFNHLCAGITFFTSNLSELSQHFLPPFVSVPDTGIIAAYIFLIKTLYVKNSC